MKKHLLLAFSTLIIVGFSSLLIGSNSNIISDLSSSSSEGDVDLFEANLNDNQQAEALDINDFAADCENPSVQFEVVPNCEFGEQFLIEVTIDDLGGTDDVIVADDMGSTPQTVTTAGATVTFGPYPNGVNVTVTVTNANDDFCETSMANLTQEYCPTEYITTDDTYTAEDLVIDVLIDNPCADVSNVTSSTGIDFSDGTPGIGYFNAENTTLSIPEGIMLSSGDVNNAPGPTQNNSDGFTGWPGDSDLDDLAASQGSNNGTNNASIIEFDFVPYTDHISFDYLLASSEYGTFQCTYADVFGFFLTDEDGNTQNIAVIPDSNTPVAVTTVRDNTYNSSCASANEEYFDKYYGTPNGLPGVANPVSFRGYTVKLTAEADVVPGQTYHIKLALADYSDTSYDSAVFLEAGSFDIGEVDLGPDLTVENQNAPCEQSSAILDSGIEGDIADISWYLDDELLEGETDGSIEVTEDGTYTIIVIYGGSCVIDDEIYVEFAPVPQFEFDEQEVSLCGMDFATLDGTPNNLEEFTGNQISYEWYLDGNQIPGENDATLEVTEPGAYEIVVTTDLGCEGSHIFNVTDAGFDIDLGEDMIFCDQDAYELTAEIPGDVTNPTFEWEGPGVDGETGQTVTVSESGIYTVSVTTEDCTGTQSVNLEFDESAQFDLGGNVFTADLAGVELDATPSNMDPDSVTYEWEFNGDPIPEDGPIVYPEDYGYGTYTVTIYGDNPDCLATQTVEVTEEEIFCNVELMPNNELTADLGYCEGDPSSSYEITFNAEFESENATEEVEYTWYLNGEVMEDVTGTSYTINYEGDGEYNDEITVEVNVQGCTDSATLNTDVFIGQFETPCKISEGISPGNNDGINDFLDLTFLNGRSGIEKFTVYNRYGTKVYEQENYSDQWYGQDKNGDELPSSTYYYVIKLQNEDPVFGRVEKGWIYVNQNVN